MGEEASAAEIIQLDSSSPEAPSVPPDVVMIEDDAGGEPAGARAAEEGEGAPEAAENLDDIDGDTAVRADPRSPPLHRARHASTRAPPAARPHPHTAPGRPPPPPPPPPAQSEKSDDEEGGEAEQGPDDDEVDEVDEDEVDEDDAAAEEVLAELTLGAQKRLVETAKYVNPA
jgi:hypothetical protein